jgi:predicted ATPase
MSAMALEKNRKFVISGPPGAGKSTLINFLAQEGILTIPEVYATVIREAISNGTDKTLSKDKTALYSSMIKKQLEWEDQLPVGSIAFLDRSIVDILLFISSYEVTLPEHILQKIGNVDYDLVFHLQSLPEPFYSNEMKNRDEYMRCAREEGIKMAQGLQQKYKEYHIPSIDVPYDTTENMAQFIKNKVAQFIDTNNK